MKKLMFVLGLMILASKAYAIPTPAPVALPTGVLASSQAVTGLSAAVSISSVTGVGPFSAGYYTYITSLHIEQYASTAQTGAVTHSTCTLAGFANNPSIHFPSAMALGTMNIYDSKFVTPIQSTQGGTASVTCGATAGVLWNIIVGYYQGQ